MLTYFSILTLIVGAIFYFLGWMYLYYYLNYFGFSIFEVDVPFHYFFIYSFAIFDNISFFNSAGLAISAIVTILYFSFRNSIINGTNSQYVRKNIFKTWRFDTLILIGTWPVLALMALFLFGHDLARSTAFVEGARISEGTRGTVILFKDPVIKTINDNFDESSVFLANKYLTPENADITENFITIIIFSTTKRYFLLLKNRKINSSASLAVSIAKDDVIFIGRYL